MGFDPEYEVFLEEAKAESNFEMRTRNLNTKYMKKIYKEKLKVAHEYQKFLFRTLKMVLHHLEIEPGLVTMHQDKKNFIEYFCALAYFRIPDFRKHLLKILQQTVEVLPKHTRALNGISQQATKDNKKGQRLNELRQQQKNNIFGYELR